MAKFNCKCGNVIRTSGEIPNRQEWLFISDVDYDAIQGKVDAEDLYKKFDRMFMCDNCGRLWFYRDGFDKAPVSYFKET